MWVCVSVCGCVYVSVEKQCEIAMGLQCHATQHMQWNINAPPPPLNQGALTARMTKLRGEMSGRKRRSAARYWSGMFVRAHCSRM